MKSSQSIVDIFESYSFKMAKYSRLWYIANARFKGLQSLDQALALRMSRNGSKFGIAFLHLVSIARQHSKVTFCATNCYSKV